MQVWTNILSRISSDNSPSDAELLMVAQQADELRPIDQTLRGQGAGEIRAGEFVSTTVANESV